MTATVAPVPWWGWVLGALAGGALARRAYNRSRFSNTEEDNELYAKIRKLRELLKTQRKALKRAAKPHFRLDKSFAGRRLVIFYGNIGKKESAATVARDTQRDIENLVAEIDKTWAWKGSNARYYAKQRKLMAKNAELAKKARRQRELDLQAIPDGGDGGAIKQEYRQLKQTSRELLEHVLDEYEGMDDEEYGALLSERDDILKVMAIVNPRQLEYLSENFPHVADAARAFTDRTKGMF